MVEESEVDTVRVPTVVDDPVGEVVEGVASLGPTVAFHRTRIVDEEDDVVFAEVVFECGWARQVENWVVTFLSPWRWKRWDDVGVGLDEVDDDDAVIKFPTAFDLLVVCGILNEDLLDGQPREW